MTPKEEADFATTLNLIAINHGCTVSINWEQHIISFWGEPEKKFALMQELDEILA